MTKILRQTESHIQTSLPQAIVGSIETLTQGLEFLETLSDADYQFVAQPHVTSSIGEHFRHWLDLFHAIAIDPTRIDYNIRRRGHVVEREVATAKREILSLIEWICALPAAELSRTVKVETEVLLSQTHVEEVESTLSRELTFVTLHATHHFAMARVIASLRGIESAQCFGIAPTTASYQRAQ